MDSSILSLGYEPGWTPDTIGKLYVDDYDFNGIFWWISKIEQAKKEAKNNSK